MSTTASRPPAKVDSLHRASQIATIGLLVLALLLVLRVAYFIAVPLVAALVLFLLLRPLAGALARLLPRPLGAALILLVIVGCLALGFAGLRAPAEAWVERVPQAVVELRYKAEALLEPLVEASRAGAQLEEAAARLDGRDPAARAVEVQRPSLLSRVSASLWDVLAGLGLMLVILYFLLAAGETFIGRVIAATPNIREKQRAIRLLDDIEDDVSTYLATTAAINVTLGIVVGLALHLCGLPNAALWGVMVAGLNFVPYLGSLVGVAIVAVVSLISFESATAALLPPLLYAACSTLEGQLVTPSLLGQRLAINPLFVFLAVVFWSWMWGVAGALLAVPLLVCFRALCANVEPLRDIAVIVGSRLAMRNRSGVAGVSAATVTGHEDTDMNWDQIEGNWKQVKGKLQQRWGKLTDDDLDQIDGRREEAIGRIQKAYGIAREQAEKDLDDWYRTL